MGRQSYQSFTKSPILTARPLSSTKRAKPAVLKVLIVGVWEPAEELIIVKRSQLRSLRDYAGTLLREAAHAIVAIAKGIHKSTMAAGDVDVVDHKSQSRLRPIVMLVIPPYIGIVANVQLFCASTDDAINKSLNERRGICRKMIDPSMCA